MNPDQSRNFNFNLEAFSFQGFNLNNSGILG